MARPLAVCLRDVGAPTECALNLRAALDELRRTEDVKWVTEKLEAAGLMENGHAVARHNKNGLVAEGAAASPSKMKRERPAAGGDGGIPVEDLKRIIRELKLNTGQSFWKNHVTAEELIEVLLSHYKARQPPTKLSTTVGRPLHNPKPNYESIRLGLMSARMRPDDTTPGTEPDAPPSYAGMLSRFRYGDSLSDGKGKGRHLVTSRPSNAADIPVKGWRDFGEDSTEGMLYRTRVGTSRNWQTTKHRALTSGLAHRASVSAYPFFTEAALVAFGGDIDGPGIPPSGTRAKAAGAGEDDTEGDSDIGTRMALTTDGRNERQGEYREDPGEDEATIMRRKCAKSIYELSTRPDKGPLLMDNGVLEALSVLSGESMVKDAETIRYVGASYVNLAGLNPEHCGDMLKSQVVRCLHRLWVYAKTLAYPWNFIAAGGSDSNSIEASDESDEAWRIRTCGLDVVYHSAVAMCHLTMIMGSENVVMQERGVEAIMWYARHEHGNERLKMLGLQCLVNFHLYTPTGTLHEAMLPCLKQLGQSRSVLIRRFTGKAICAIAGVKQGAQQLLACGVLGVLASLPILAPDPDPPRCGEPSTSKADGLLLDVCAQASSLLTCAKAEFVRQALISPETVGLVLETLYSGSGGGNGSDDHDGAVSGEGDKGNKNTIRRRSATSCRLNGARVLSAIFGEANTSDIARLIQLGFLQTAERFLRQATTFQDPKPLELLCHGIWHVTVNLADTRPIPKIQPVTTFAPHASGTKSGGRGLYGTQHRHESVLKNDHRALGVIGSSGASRGIEQSHLIVSGGPGDGSSHGEEVPGFPRDMAGGRRRRSSDASIAASAIDMPRASIASAVGGLLPKDTRVVAGGLPRRSSRFVQPTISSALISRRTSIADSDNSVSTSANISVPVDAPRQSIMKRSSQGSLVSGGGKRRGSRSCVHEGSAMGDKHKPREEATQGFRRDGAAVRTGGSSVGAGDTQSVSSCSGSVVDGGNEKPHIVECGLMDQLLRLAESGLTSLSREYCMGALCNLACKAWITVETCEEVGFFPTLFKALALALTRGEEGICQLAAKGIWNMVSRTQSDRPFMEACMESGVVGGLCGAARGATDLLAVLEEDEDEERSRGQSSLAHLGSDAADTDERTEEVVLTARRDDMMNGEDNTAFRYKMRDTVKACLKALHAILRHKWARSNKAVLDIRADLLSTLVSSSVGGTQVQEIAMGIICNLTHDICCEVKLLEETGAIQHIFSQAFSRSMVVLRRVAGTLGNLTHVLESTPTGRTSTSPSGPTIFMVLKRLAETDDLCLAFRASSILYGLTRKPNYVNVLTDLRGVSNTLFKLFRSGVLQIQNYCLQTFFNLAHNKEFAMSVVNSNLMEDFIVACMVQTNSSHIKEMSSQVLYYLISNPNTRLAVFRGKGLWTLVQLAAVSGSVISMRLALLALFNLFCDLRANTKWLDEHALALVLEFDDEVLGAPAFPGLLYQASTHQGRLSKMLISTRIAREARVKTEGLKFLRRNRALEEDEEFLARATAVDRPDEDEESETDDVNSIRNESFEENGQEEEQDSDNDQQRSRLRFTFVHSHLLPTLAMVYNLCCKSAKASKLFFRHGVPETLVDLLEEMRNADEQTHYHPQVEVLCAAILGSLIEDSALIPKLVERRITPAIVQGLGSRIVPVRLASLWALLLLSVPVVGTHFSSSGERGGQCRSWMLFCRQAVIECKVVAALRALWQNAAVSLAPEAREHVRYAIFTTVRHFFMDQAAAAAVVRQRGAELLSETMEFSSGNFAFPSLTLAEDGFGIDEAATPLSNVTTVCCAVPTVYLPGIPVQSVCEGCLSVFLRILPTFDDDVRDLCSMAMRCLAGKEDLLLELIMQPRFTSVLQMLLEDSTPVGGAHIRAILQRIVVLSAAPDTADLSPALLDLTDCVFQRSARSAGGSNSVRNASAVNVETTPDVRKSAATVGAAPGVFSKGRKAGASISRARAGSKQTTAEAPNSPPRAGGGLGTGTESGRSYVEHARAQRMNRLRAKRGMSSNEVPRQSLRPASPGRISVATPILGSPHPPKESIARDGEKGHLTTVGLSSKFNVFQETGSAEKSPDGSQAVIEPNGDSSRARGEQKTNQLDEAATFPVVSPTVETGLMTARGRPGDGCEMSASKHGWESGPDRMTRVGRHTSVAMWGLSPRETATDPAEEERQTLIMLETVDSCSQESSGSDPSCDEQLLDITYTESEVRQVKRLMFRVVEAQLPAATEDSVAENMSQLREVTRRACTEFQRSSGEFRKEVLRTRRGQASPFPRADRPFEDEGESSRESTPDSDVSTVSRPMDGSSVWDPAMDLLRQNGLEGLVMAPQWEFSRALNLCTTRFVEDQKAVYSPEVVSPGAVPNDLLGQSNKEGHHMPLGLECCILAPLIRPPPDAAPDTIKSDATKTKTIDEPSFPEISEGEDSSERSPSDDDASVATFARKTSNNRTHGKGSSETGAGSASGGRKSVAPISGHRTTIIRPPSGAGRGDHSGHQSRAARVRRKQYRRDSRGDGGGCGVGGVIGTVMHETVDGGAEVDGVGSDADITPSSRGGFQISPFVASTVIPTPLWLAGAVSQSAFPPGLSRSIVPALESDQFSLRTRRAGESREAGQARQRLMLSLGVGKRTDGKHIGRGGVRLSKHASPSSLTQTTVAAGFG